MRRSMKSRWILAGLCSLTAMFMGVRVAEAGSMSAITITGGYKPGGGDPPYVYTVDFTLNPPATPGTNTFTTNDFVEISGLPGVNSGSTVVGPTTDFPSVAWSLPQYNTFDTPGGSAPFASDVTEFFLGTKQYQATNPGSPIDLGTFVITSSFGGFTEQPLPTGFEVSYTFSVDGVIGSGFFIFNVPEPSSAILLASGAGLIPVILVVRRRRQPEPRDAN